MAFLHVLEEYGRHLDSPSSRLLDVKGCGWICAFPAPNVTVSLGEDADAADQFSEAAEVKADSNPRSVDFLGNGIDCGFRIAHHSDTDRFVAGVELAWLLAQAAHLQLFTRTFVYHDRHVLKGVIKSRPYPVVAINTERRPSRRETVGLERFLSGRPEATPVPVRNFLNAFMRDESIEFPHLDGLGDQTQPLPPSYEAYREAWIKQSADLEKTLRSETQAELDQGAGSDVPSPVNQAIDEVLAKATETAEGAADGVER